MRVKNLFRQKEARRSLRRNATPQEVILWSILRDKRLGFSFRRQDSFGKYVVDFYCPVKKLVVEVDGIQHEDNRRYDEARTLFLERCGCRVLRFWNSDVNNNREGVVLKIQEALDETTTVTPPRPPL